MSLIDRIMQLSGPMPDPERHRRYLATLNTRQLQEREAALASPWRGDVAPVEFWPHKKNGGQNNLKVAAPLAIELQREVGCV